MKREDERGRQLRKEGGVEGEKMAGNKRGVVDWTEAPDPTMRHNRAPTMVLHMKEGREWRPGEIGARSVILYLTRVPVDPLFPSSSSFSRSIAVYRASHPPLILFVPFFLFLSLSLSLYLSLSIFLLRLPLHTPIGWTT